MMWKKPKQYGERKSECTAFESYMLIVNENQSVSYLFYSLKLLKIEFLESIVKNLMHSSPCSSSRILASLPTSIAILEFL